jgi:hypothetical protein
MTNTIKTAAEHGTEDATTFYSETDRDDVVAAIVDWRSGRSAMPDESLINAMGRRWVVRQAVGDAAKDTDDEWERQGLPWCEAYNAAYLSTLERLAA